MLHLVCRAAMTPFLANQSFGVDSYKWILFGEDDTVLFVENALKLLGHLDPDLPYFLTDNIHYPQKHIDGGCVFFGTVRAQCLICLQSSAHSAHSVGVKPGPKHQPLEGSFALVVVAPHWYCACF